MHLTQGLHRSLQINPNGIATIYGSRRRTWKELVDRIARLAGALRALGVSPGDRVAMLAHNSDRYLEYYYAVLWVGAVVAPINTRWSMAEILYSLNDSTPTVMFFDANFAIQAAELCGKVRSLRHLVFADDGESPGGVHHYERLIADARPIEDVRCGGGALAAIMYTGGTTGFPKGVMLSHFGIVSSSLMMAPVLRASHRDINLHAAPMFHMAAAGMMLTVTLFGGTHVIVPGFSPKLVSDTVASESVTNVLFVPTMLKMLLDYIDDKGGDLSSIRTLVYGASPMPESLLLRTIAALPDVRMINAYGQTELSPVASLLEPEYHVLEGTNAGRLRSVGRGVAGLDVKIVAEDGTERPQGEVGEIWVRGPNIMLGYWNKSDVTAATIIDGWVRTGDAAFMDEDGFLFIVDRVKDMIISGGENVFSAEVENAILQHPAIVECAVIGVPDELWGERVHAVVVSRTGELITPELLIDHCRTLIAGYKCPRSVEFRVDPLPLSAAGKILKGEIRKAYWPQRGRNIN